MFKKILLCLVFCGIAPAVYAQSLADIQNPKIISPPPEAASLGKYGQIPVDKSTGIPNISVPIYEIKTPRFSLPISLSYHASGIKVSEMSTWVGAGWSLNAGGVITRAIIGLADDGPGGFLSSTTTLSAQMNTFNQAPNTIDYNTGTQPFDNACTQVDEFQPDNFFYNFAGNSGAFVFGPDAARTPVLTPYKPLKITYTQPGIGITGTFTVLDEAGNAYYFNNTEFASNSNYQSSYADSWYLTQMISADKSDTLTFQYQADTVMSAQVYPTYTQTYSYIPNRSFGDFVGGTGCPVGAQTGQINSSVNITDFYKPLYIKTILFKGGRVDFVAKGGRLEGTQNFYGPHLSLDSVIVSNYDYNQKIYTRLKSFKIYTGYWNNPLAKYPLTNPPIYTGSIYRLRLDSMAENDQNGIAIKTHKFGYDPVALPPINYYAQDYWGYYNGQVQNPSLLQQQQSIDFNVNLYTIGNANRNINASYMKAGMLEKITYPTKGYTIFSYEPHQYFKYNSANLPQKTAHTSSVGYHQETNTTTFTTDVLPGQPGGAYQDKAIITYTLNEISGVSTAAPIVELIYTANNTIVWQQVENSNTSISGSVAVTLYPGEQYELYASSPGGDQNSQPLPVAGISVTYQVNLADSATAMASGGGLRIRSIQNYDANGSILGTETYKYGSSENGAGILMNGNLALVDSVNRVYWALMNTTKVDPIYGFTYQQDCSGMEDNYSSNPVYPLSTLSGSPVAYGAVTIYHGDTINNIGKSRYEYISYPDSILQTSFSYQNGTMPIPVGWKNGQLVHEAHYLNSGNGQYSLEQEKYTNYYNMPRSSAMGIYVGYKFETNGFSNPAWPQPNTYSIYEPDPTYELLQKYIYFSYPISTGTAVPAQTTTINYAFDGVTVLTQDTTHFYYDNHVHMFPTRIVNYDGKGDSILKKVLYPQDMVNSGLDPTGIYSAMASANIVSPVIQFTQSKLNTNTQLMQSVTSYASTNGVINPQNVSLQVMANPAETRLSYQKYDTRGNLAQVAKTYGAPTSYIWGYDGAYPVAEVKNAAVKDIFFESFEDGNGNTADARTGRYSYVGVYSRLLTGLDAGSYSLTYWQKSGSVWTLVTTPETVPVNGNFTISLNGQVDDIRFYPANALMMTYTYDPLIGVTSTTDAKGLINYYEYDSFQRLVNIRDQYNNIVKSFCYNYAGQVSTCFIDLPSFKSAAISKTFTRNNCSTGYDGTAMTYSLPAGTYVSNTSQNAADSLAQADVAAYGQTYANVNGTCLQNIAFTMTNNTTASGPGGVAVGMQITFSGPANYTYTMPSSGSQVIQIPTGTYSISVGSDENHYPHHIQLGSGTAVYMPSTLFSGVNIATGSSTLTLTISN